MASARVGAIFHITVTLKKTFYTCLFRQKILFPIAENGFKKATADDKKLKINSFH